MYVSYEEPRSVFAGQALGALVVCCSVNAAGVGRGLYAVVLSSVT